MVRKINRSKFHMMMFEHQTCTHAHALASTWQCWWEQLLVAAIFRAEKSQYFRHYPTSPLIYKWNARKERSNIIRSSCGRMRWRAPTGSHCKIDSFGDCSFCPKPKLDQSRRSRLTHIREDQELLSVAHCHANYARTCSLISALSADPRPPPRPTLFPFRNTVTQPALPAFERRRHLLSESAVTFPATIR